MLISFVAVQEVGQRFEREHPGYFEAEVQGD
jgi:hypothetical protein